MLTFKFADPAISLVGSYSILSCPFD